MDMSDARANFLPTNSNVAGYQNNVQMNRYSIEHPQGDLYIYISNNLLRF